MIKISKIDKILYGAFLIVCSIFPFIPAIIAISFLDGNSLSYRIGAKPVVILFVFNVIGYVLYFVFTTYKRDVLPNKVFLNLLIITFPLMIFLSFLFVIFGIEDITFKFRLIYICYVLLSCVIISGLYVRSKNSEYLIISMIELFAIIIRVVTIFFFKTQPVSDFERVYNYAKMYPFDKSSSSFIEFANNAIYSPYYGIESITLRSVLNLLNRSVISGQLFNVFVSGIVILFVFKSCKIIFRDIKYAYIASIAYAFLPTAILQDTYFAHENYVLLFTSIYLYYLIKIIRNRQERMISEQSSYLKIFDLLMAGVSLGILNLYKPIMIVYILSAVIVLLFSLSAMLVQKEALRNWLKMHFLPVFIIVILSIGVYKSGELLLEKYINHSVVVSPYKSIIFGLNTYSANGQWSPEIEELSTKFIIESNGDISLYNKKVKDYLVQDWKENPSKIPLLFRNKFSIAWGPEGSTYYVWATQGITENVERILSRMRADIISVSDGYTLFLYVLCFIGILFSDKAKKYYIISLSSTVFLISVMLLITEAQTRYKSIMFVQICILASIGIETIYNLVEKKRFKSNV